MKNLVIIVALVFSVSVFAKSKEKSVTGSTTDGVECNVSKHSNRDGIPSNKNLITKKVKKIKVSSKGSKV